MKRSFRLLLLGLLVLLTLSATACGRRERSLRWDNPTAPTLTIAAVTMNQPTEAVTLTTQPSPTSLPEQPTATRQPSQTPAPSLTAGLSSDPEVQELLQMLDQLQAENAQGDAFGDLP